MIKCLILVFICYVEVFVWGGKSLSSSKPPNIFFLLSSLCIQDYLCVAVFLIASLEQVESDYYPWFKKKNTKDSSCPWISLALVSWPLNWQTEGFFCRKAWNSEFAISKQGLLSAETNHSANEFSLGIFYSSVFSAFLNQIESRRLLSLSHLFLITGQVLVMGGIVFTPLYIVFTPFCVTSFLVKLSLDYQAPNNDMGTFY